ncbi:amidohydrolase [Sedimentibacter acidaminivorans]|uniref:Amidohydrolase n=1 Tax=Sedimentibacter acidaminivorans TaxID=913099 RepID=A0ABS4G9H2_9FIRM|nr:amidohydrolase [Sedimentibacter acidaminivorans]MBP1924341.1 amidohydrolase [Sedimentibacter acidaminivorans]
MNQIFQEIDNIKEKLISYRRYIHKHPEVGFETKNTEKYITEFLNSKKIEIIPSNVGVIGIIRGNNTREIIALRADIDALNLDELNEVEYKSQNLGKMHACGHDGHTAMLMGASEVLINNRDKLKYDILLIFQPAEEGPDLGGARIMLKDLETNGLLSKIKYIYGQHITTEYELGSIPIKYGSLTASTDEFTIEIVGKGGHAGIPQEAVDAISISSKFINEMESFISRKIDPFDPVIFSIGTINGGSAKNIIAEKVSLSGTIRCQSEKSRKYVLESVEKVLKGICLYTGASYKLDILHGLPVLVSDDAVMDIVKGIAINVVGENNVTESKKSSMGAEDFAYFAQKIPSAFVWIGARNEKKGFVNLMHNPKFDFDEDALLIGVRMFCSFALQG